MREHILFIVFTIITLIDLTGSIIGGKNVKIKQFPYLVSVQFDGVHICGGIIIDESTILTAAHCIERDKCVLQHTVRVGTTIHNEGQEYLVVDAIIHKHHNKLENNDFDIAILKLFGNLKYNSNIQPIALQERNKEIPSNSVCQVSGWGLTETETISRNLKATNVSVVSYEDCSKYYTIALTSNMICASTLKCSRMGLTFQHVFEGDSGGPLVCEGKLVGIVSFGGDNPDYPSVYTKISALHDWVMSNNKHSKPKNYCAKRKHS